MKIKIYYGGRGLIDDPTLYVTGKLQEVLEELNVEVERFNLYEMKNMINTLPHTMNDADGVILASTVEWYGIGGLIHNFLDACWLYGDKEKIADLYMCPVVMATTYGEKSGMNALSEAWEILGGRVCNGLCGYITDTMSLEMNKDYNRIIERKAEEMYRTINQRAITLPASDPVMRQSISVTRTYDLTPQESEQLSQYTSDEEYVQRQKEDIQELTSLFQGMLDHQEKNESKSDILREFQNAFYPQPGISANYRFRIEGMDHPLYMAVSNTNLTFGEFSEQEINVDIGLSMDTLDEIFAGEQTFQRGFMSGHLVTKGDYKLLRALDQLFPFAGE